MHTYIQSNEPSCYLLIFNYVWHNSMKIIFFGHKKRHNTLTYYFWHSDLIKGLSVKRIMHRYCHSMCIWRYNIFVCICLLKQNCIRVEIAQIFFLLIYFLLWKKTILLYSKCLNVLVFFIWILFHVFHWW